MKDQFTEMNLKQKLAIKIQKMNTRYFLESNFMIFNRLFNLVYSNQDNNAKRFKARRYYLQKKYYEKL